MTLDEIDQEIRLLGCGDNGCSVAQRGGMGTNGGCHCLDGVRDPYDRVRLRKILGLRKEQARMQAEEIARLRAAIAGVTP